MIYFGGETVSFFAAITVHELGHLAAMLLLSKADMEIQLTAAGIYINPKYKCSISKSAEAVILIAGPIFGAAAGVAFKSAFPTFFKAGLILSAANMIPIKGTDGGSLLELYCGSRYRAVESVSAAALFTAASAMTLLPIWEGGKAEPIWLAAAAVLYLRGKFEK